MRSASTASVAAPAPTCVPGPRVGGRESATTRYAPRPGEADGRRARARRTTTDCLARALTGTCRPQPAYPGHGRGSGPIRFAGAAARPALTSDGPDVSASSARRRSARAERWLTSTGDAIIRRCAAPPASSRPRPRASAYVRCVAALRPLGAQIATLGLPSSTPPTYTPRPHRQGCSARAAPLPAACGARFVSGPPLSPRAARAARQRGACRGASEADGAGLRDRDQDWQVVACTYPASAFTRRRQQVRGRGARRPIRFARPRGAHRASAFLPVPTRGGTTRGPRHRRRRSLVQVLRTEGPGGPGSSATGCAPRPRIDPVPRLLGALRTYRPAGPRAAARRPEPACRPSRGPARRAPA